MGTIDKIILNGVSYDIGGSGSGLTPSVKSALLQIADNVVYADDDGDDYYNALDAALNPPSNLVSISAVFTQGQHVIYDTDSLDVLRQYLTVTAYYSDSTSGTVTSYSLSGNLTTGTSTITVSYGGKTTTFTVTVTHSSNSEVIDQYTMYDSLDYTTFENVTGTSGTNNIVTDAGTINASKVNFTWNTTECNLFQIQICQYNSSGVPYKFSSLNKTAANAITSGEPFDTTSGAWKDAGESGASFTAIAGGNITVNLPTSGKFRLQLRKTNDSTGTEVSDNASFRSWVSGDGITITALL